MMIATIYYFIMSLVRRVLMPIKVLAIYTVLILVSMISGLLGVPENDY